MSARRGSPRIERLPSARGPHSMRPWNQPTTLPSAIAAAVRWHSVASSAMRSTVQPAASKSALRCGEQRRDRRRRRTAGPSRRGPSTKCARCAARACARSRRPRRSRRRHRPPRTARRRCWNGVRSQHLAVGDRVHGAAAGEREARRRRSARAARPADGRRPPRTSPAPSARCRDAAPRAASSGRARGPEQLLQRVASTARRPAGVPSFHWYATLLAVMAEVAQVELEGAVVLELHDLPHRVDEARLAVGREPHHLVLVAVVREAEILRQRLVEDAERMREVDAAVDREMRRPRPTPQRALREVAEAVDRDADRLVEGRDEEGRGQMREVMLDGVHGAAERLVRAARCCEVPATSARSPRCAAGRARSTGSAPRGQRRSRACARGWRALSLLTATCSTSASAMPASREAVADRFAGKAAPSA